MLTSEVSVQPIRINSSYLDGGASVYSIRLLPADARSLGLREGQTLNATVAARPEGNLIVFNDKTKQPILLPKNSGIEPGNVRLSISVAVAGGAALSALVKDQKRSVQPSIDRIHSLLGRASGVGASWQSLLSRMTGEGDPIKSLSDGDGSRLTTLNLGGRISQISRDLYLSLLQSGLYNEYQLGSGEKQQVNLKELIIRLLKLQQVGQGERAGLTSVLDDIETNQLEALGASLNRSVSLNWPIPLINDWPVAVHLESGSDESETDTEEESEGREWRVDLKFRVDELSNMEARILMRSEDLRLHLWCPNLVLYQEAQSHRDWLIEMAREIGIQITELRIFPTEKIPADKSSIFERDTSYKPDHLGISIDV